MRGRFSGNGDASVPNDNLPPHPTSPSRERRNKKNPFSRGRRLGGGADSQGMVMLQFLTITCPLTQPLPQGRGEIKKPLLQGEKAGMRGRFSGNGGASIPNDNLPPHPTSPSRERRNKKNPFSREW